MAKDYFQDILPPNDKGRGQSRSTPLRRDPDVRPNTVEESSIADEVGLSYDTPNEPAVDPLDADLAGETTPEKSIRNISAPSRRMRDDLSDAPRYSPPMPQPRRSSRKWMWAIVAVLVAVVGMLILIAFRGTSVVVEPRSHTVIFDETSRFTAYPQTTAPAGSLTYTTQTVDVEDSEPVESSGTVHAEEKASGTITVFNEYSNSPVRLVKNTRFESAAGLIFRAPADIVIPGKSGTTAGQISVTVIADQSGAQYNIESSRLTVPGLKGTDEFSKVYAQSSVAFTGGFSGDRPGISDSSLAAARTAVRGRLEQKVRESISSLSTESVITFPELAQITYTDLPTTAESGNGARIHEKASALVPLIPAADFALTVARTVSAEADNASIRMVPMKDFGGLLVSASSTPGTDPVQFQLTGQAMLVWQINSAELAQALAGRDQSAFQTIVTGFPGIQSATARIEPFWSNAFPDDASRIRVKVSDPVAAQ